MHSATGQVCDAQSAPTAPWLSAFCFMHSTRSSQIIRAFAVGLVFLGCSVPALWLCVVAGYICGLLLAGPDKPIYHHSRAPGCRGAKEHNSQQTCAASGSL